MSKTPINICITGAAGQIGYALIPHICLGKTFGPDQPVVIHLLDLNIEAVQVNLGGVKMEIEDATYPLVKGVVCTGDPTVAFTGADYVIMLGAFPRKDGMERKDLLEKNCGIFKEQGALLNTVASKTVKVLVVGNPANTNCLIAAECAPNIPKENFSALTRLDHNRATTQIALKTDSPVESVSNVIIWGNHSSTQYPDLHHATVNARATIASLCHRSWNTPENFVGSILKDAAAGKPAQATINDDAWVRDTFIPAVQKRGAAIIAARKLSSALSAAQAISDHLHDWVHGTPAGKYVSMGVWSTGNPYGIAPGLIYSIPVSCSGGKWTVVAGLAVSEASHAFLKATEAELTEEKATAMHILAA